MWEKYRDFVRRLYFGQSKLGIPEQSKDKYKLCCECSELEKPWPKSE